MSAEIIKGPTVTRSQLYELVWRHESQAVAARCGFSGSYLGRLCREWKIPKPERGHWQQMQAGQTIERPALPSCPGTENDPLVLQQGGKGYGAIMPPTVRAPRPKKPDALEMLLAEADAAAEPLRRRELEDRAAAELPATEHHVLAIDDWGVDYRMAWQPDQPGGTLSESASLALRCQYLSPNKRRGRTIQVKLLFSKDRNGKDDIRCSRFGGVYHLEGTIALFVPQDQAALLVAALSAGRLHFVELWGTPVKRGYEIVRRFQMTCQPPDPD